LQVPVGFHRLAKTREVEFGEPGVEQLGRNAALDELGEINSVPLAH
jgi:hypothetical protein